VGWWPGGLGGQATTGLGRGRGVAGMDGHGGAPVRGEGKKVATMGARVHWSSGALGLANPRSRGGAVVGGGG
jgi:hypothetical protein